MQARTAFAQYLNKNLLPRTDIIRSMSESNEKPTETPQPSVKPFRCVPRSNTDYGMESFPQPKKYRNNYNSQRSYSTESRFSHAREAGYEKFLYGDNQAGSNFTKYDEMSINIEGGEIEPMHTFKDINFGDVLNSNIKLCRYDIPTPIQKYALPCLLKGRNFIGCAQTGSGKTASYLLPAVHRLHQEKMKGIPRRTSIREPFALIVAPTRELAQQIEHETKRLVYRTDIRIISVYGGSSVNQQMDKFYYGCDILVATPGRLIDFLERQVVTLSECKYLVIDEADRMLDMGFIPQINDILTKSSIPDKSERQTVMFSATFPPEIQNLARTFLEREIKITVGNLGYTCDHIDQEFMHVRNEDKNNKMIEVIGDIKAKNKNAHFLVFVERKRDVDDIEILLYKAGYKVVSIHGDRSQNEREEALGLFKKKKAEIMVATDVAQRGIDVPKVSHVINHTFPRTIDDYVHRIGRTARCGNDGIAISFVNSEQAPIMNELIKLLRDNNQKIPTFLTEIQRTSSISRSSGGNRRFAKTLFRYSHSTNYGGQWERSRRFSRD